MRHLMFCLCLLAISGSVPAQSSGGPYVLRKQVIASGGERASGVGTVLTGTLGQPEAAVQTGSGYRLTGGFHAPRAAAPPPSRIYCDGFEATPCP